MKVVVLVVELYENVDSGCKCQLACEIDISLTISATLRHGAEKIFSLQKYKRKEKKRKATPILAKAYERNIAERKIRQKDH
jgi:hypothetical protein